MFWAIVMPIFRSIRL